MIFAVLESHPVSKLNTLLMLYSCWDFKIVLLFQAMAVAGMTSDGRHRSIDHPKVLRTPPGSPGRVRASYHTPGTVNHCLNKELI